MKLLIQVLQFSLPAVIAIATLEGLVLALVMRRDYNWRAYGASLADALGRQYLVYTLLPLSIAQPLVDLAWRHRLFTVPLDGALSVIVLVIAQDFSYYWFHRASHRVRWFWATHAIHHSSNEFNLAAAYRFGWTGKLTGAAIFYVPMIWLGFAPGPVFIAAGINLLYQFWLHAEWIPKLGWLEYVLNTPSHHRVHHACNAEYLDRNYGGIFIVFDRMFGTFVAERDDLPCHYGLVKPLRSNNPVVIAFHEWAALARDLWRSPTWRDRLACLIGPPGDGAEPASVTPAVHDAGQKIEVAVG
ncbi:sterol desaturase/sphingolipid hydroxylase (fatty acid hydroxylase superfamily) [Bradyrhizobium sp. USDA 4472]